MAVVRFSVTAASRRAASLSNDEVGPFPAELINVVEEWNVGAERGERTKQQRALTLADKRGGERTGIGGVHAPIAAICGNGFNFAELGEHGGRGLCAPSGQSGIAVRGVAHQRQVIGDGCGRRRRTSAPCRPHRGNARAAIQLNDARTLHALREVLIRRANDHLPHALISSSRDCPRGQSIVRFELHHRPDHNAGCRKHIFQQRKLRKQLAFNACAGLVTRPQSIAKRFDDVVGGNGDMRGPALDHAEHRRENAADGSDFPALGILGGRQRVIMPKQFVRAVDQVNVQGATPAPTL